MGSEMCIRDRIEYAGWVAGVDLAFHQDGSPVVCWGILGDPFTLKVAERTPGGWTIEAVPAEGQDPRFPTLAIDGNDRIAIAYSNNESPGGIWITRRQVTGWERTEVIPEPCSLPQLATAPYGALALVARRSFAQATHVTYVEETPSEWSLDDADTNARSASPRGPGFLPGEEPVLAYYVNIADTGDPVREVRVLWRDTETWNISVPFPPEGNTSSWVGWLTGVSTDGTVVLTVSERDTSNSYIALLW